MALQVSWTDEDTAITAPTAYVRLLRLEVDAEAQQIRMVLGLYKDAQARAGGRIPFAPQYNVWAGADVYAGFLGQPIDVRAAAYRHIKTLPAFSGATDV